MNDENRNHNNNGDERASANARERKEERKNDWRRARKAAEYAPHRKNFVESWEFAFVEQP